MSEGRRLLGAVLYSSYEPGELLWYDRSSDSTLDYPGY